ncbi:MAG: ribosome recycling factor [Spirochaetes bacterium]|uniref:Ribosome-recycling factor n=1 Tax=Candidatus Avitreponema avistercoris TaxID=2840705 RepID=A0A9D9ENM9_9SPIR|nr:ribosome recycling factor [Candidatus Avitreponema avistercoris]
MSDIAAPHTERMKRSVANLKDEFNGIRTGRASASLFDKIRVECYGDKTPLAQVATISVPEARLVVIQPWDKALISEIEKALQKSELGLNPSNDGKVIRLAIPPLTEERRKELVKQSKTLAEQSRVAIRNIRRDANEALKKAQKNGEITEDELKTAETALQKTTDTFIQDINKILEDKEKEILEG